VGPYECSSEPSGSIGDRLLASQRHSFMTLVSREGGCVGVFFVSQSSRPNPIPGSVKSPLQLVQGAISSVEKRPKRETALFLKQVLRFRMHRHVQYFYFSYSLCANGVLPSYCKRLLSAVEILLAKVPHGQSGDLRGGDHDVQ
jgi:hypothetical protein